MTDDDLIKRVTELEKRLDLLLEKRQLEASYGRLQIELELANVRIQELEEREREREFEQHLARLRSEQK